MAVPIDSSWKLTFDNEFNGSSLDTTKWTSSWFGGSGQITRPANPTFEDGAYDPNQVWVSDGHLHLHAVASPVTVGGHNYAYRTGAIESANKFEQDQGYFEAKITIPSTGGVIANWPNFWTTSHNWPAGGEV